MKQEDIRPHWDKRCTDTFVGQSIVRVRYTNKTEQKNLGWYNSSIVLELDSGHLILPSRDDEGNDCGVLGITQKGKEFSTPIFPELRDATTILPKIRRLLQKSPIVKAEYLSEDTARSLDWYSIPVVFTLENGTKLMPQKDSSGSDGGAFFTTYEKFPTVPVIS